MKSERTPGPWTPGGRSGNLRPDSCKTYLGKPYQETSRVLSTNEKGHLKSVACVFQGEGGVGSPQALAEQKANMALICAAPELLEALRGMMHQFGDNEQYDEEDAAVVASARVAIAKATGGEA